LIYTDSGLCYIRIMTANLIIPYFFALVLTAAILIAAYRLNRKYARDFVSFYFFHLLVASPLAVLGKPLSILVVDAMRLDQLQTDQLVVIFELLLSRPLWILSIFFLIKCIAALVKTQVSRTFVLFYFLAWSGFLCAGLILVVPFLKSGMMTQGFQTLNLVKSYIDIFSALLIFAFGIIRSVGLQDRVRKNGAMIFSILGFVSRSIFWTLIFLYFSFTVPFLFNVAIPIPALFFLAYFAEKLSREEKDPLLSDGRIQDLASRFHITPRENEIIGHICSGRSNKDIAQALFISVNTVKRHANRIYSKVGVNNRVQLVNRVRESLENEGVQDVSISLNS
jgi:DNA-binding CsgD family transcriptional regulator